MPVSIRPYKARDEAAVVALWIACGLTRAWNDPHKDIARKLAVDPTMFLVCEQDGELVGTAMFGYEGHRGWVNYLAVSPAHRRHGIARTLMRQGEQLLREAGCPKLNLQVREGNQDALAFYKSLGYQDDQVISLGLRLIADH